MKGHQMRLLTPLCFLLLLAAPTWAQQASVAGTDGTNALGALPCAAFAGQPMSNCPAELLRKDDRNVTIRVLLPGGKVRYIYFEDGTAKSTDSTAKMTAETMGDNFVIYIDPGETFEIPKRAVANR
jgi:hypothetical protein